MLLLGSASMMIRREEKADQEASRAIQVEAFRQSETEEPIEANLLDSLRDCDGWIPELSWVAEVDGAVVGHAICTRGHVDDVPCVGLGPIGVAPDLQRKGVGSSIMHALIGASDAMGEPLIALLGDPSYYSRFGFVASAELGIEPPEAAWGVYFQVRPLTAWSASITGQFRYAAPFDELD